jgi:hypothetical protein
MYRRIANESKLRLAIFGVRNMLLTGVYGELNFQIVA